jgi:hypothetical protein
VEEGTITVVCPGCGRPTAALTRYCGWCGARLTDGAADAPAPAGGEAAAIPAADPRRHPHRGAIVTAIAVVAVAVVGALVVIAFGAGTGTGNGSGSRTSRVGVHTAAATSEPLATRPPAPRPAAGEAHPAPHGTRVFAGRGFAIRYPRGWRVADAERQYPWGLDTTIVAAGAPRTLLRIDETPGLATSDPLAAARPEVARVSRQPGYRQIALRRVRVDGRPAALWEFEAPVAGVLLRTTDEFLVTPSGVGFAVLTQAPASRYGALRPTFDAVRATLRPR